ncbi:MAG: hypothetical protein GX115_08325 [Ruminiclostridium sp.]|nr:hypothetical protein [Ruminiclostridium sp.]
MELQTHKPTLEISQYKARALLGYKNTGDAVSEWAQLGKQKAMEYIANKAEEGNRLKAIERGGNPIREIVIEKAWPQKQRQGTYTPVVGPQYHATPGEVSITPPPVNNPTHIGYRAQYLPGELNVQYNPAVVNIYMRQYPEISIDVSI